MPTAGHAPTRRHRPSIAFLSFEDVFEDFYPRHGVTRTEFARRWAGSGNHALLRVVQETLADVTWYEHTLGEPLADVQHAAGFRVAWLRSSLAHRALWEAFYARDWSWRLHGRYRAYALLASYLAPMSRATLARLRADRPDAVLVQDYSSGRFDVACAAARVLGVPLVAYHAGSTADSFVGVPLRRRTLPHAHVLASSAAERARVVRDLGVPESSAHVVLTPVDVSRFRPLGADERQARSELARRPPYVLFVGRLDDAMKRVSALVEAFAQVAPGYPDAELVLVGDGPDRERLERLAAERAGTRVHFAGWVSDPDELAAVYSGAAALALPSRREGFPTVVAEAMACGTPVVATDVGGASELVETGRTGWLVPPADDVALARAVQASLQPGPAREEMRRACRERALARVAPDVVAEQLRAVFRRAGLRVPVETEGTR